MIITSKDNEIIKNIKKLHDKKYRIDSYIVEGIKMVKEAISENQLIELIAIREDFKINFDAKNIKIITVSSKVLTIFQT